MAMIGQIVLDKKLGVICMIIFEAPRRFFLCSQVLLIQISIFSLLFQFISNIRQFMFVFGMFENWKTLFHSDPDKMELSVEFLQSFLLALQKEYGIPSWEYMDCMDWWPWNMMIIFWLKKLNAGLKKNNNSLHRNCIRGLWRDSISFSAIINLRYRYHEILNQTVEQRLLICRLAGNCYFFKVISCYVSSDERWKQS